MVLILLRNATSIHSHLDARRWRLTCISMHLPGLFICILDLSFSLFLSGRTKTMSATFRDSRHTSCWIHSREQTLSFEGFPNDKDDDPFVVLRSSAIDDQRMEEEETRWFNIEFKWPPKERKHVCTQVSPGQTPTQSTLSVFWDTLSLSRFHVPPIVLYHFSSHVPDDGNPENSCD